MEAETLLLLVAALLAVPLCWASPRHVAQDVVAGFSAFALATVSPLSAGWLATSSIGTVAALTLGRRTGWAGLTVAAWSTVLLAGLLIPRERPSWELVGAAYYTLRNLHVLLDGWMERDRLPTLREMLRYQFFLPVLVVGPIHRLPNFRRALNQRRLNHTDLALGAERALLGLAQVTIVGTVLMQPVQRWAARGVEGFWEYWLLSAVEWVQLYFVFAGLSSFAVGASRMMGLTIEENFDRPFAARSLLDFWTRWHISLSRWCRDYVFQPVTAALRSPLAGLAAAMLAIGLWHETSAYYVLWGLWQVIGIVLNRVVLVQAERHGLVLPSWLGAILAPVLLLAWLSLARPVIQMLLGGVA